VSESKLQVVGLNEFRKGLRDLDRSLPKTVRLALNHAADVLIGAVRPRVPRRTGRAAASLKAQSTQTVARVSVGGRQAPYYSWLDFGGRVGRRHSVKRPYITGGRYIYPTLASHGDKIRAEMLKALEAVARSAGVGVE